MNRLRILRLREKMTQREAAEVFEMNPTVYARYEREERVLPLDLALKIAIYYGVSLDYLACRDIKE